VEAIAQFGAWAWVVAGLILLGLEILAPGNVLVWFGIAAILTGLFELVADLGWQVNFLLFAILSIILVIVGRRYFARRGSISEQPFLNQRANALVGQRHVLAEPLVGGQGRIRIDDTMWRITGPDLPSGTKVRVTRADGALLTVEKDAAA
ncbi:MAG TPA: NfeD family protein, partial [Bauldia sp.]|nr:NfeD family protein [Bauldia sp.]